MKLRDIDLNLLVVFNQVLLDRSSSTAAEKLGMSQPAVSNALRRMRLLLKDELFVRTAKGMEPTPYALHLAEPVVYALNALQTALAHSESFDPLTSARTFHLVMTDIGEMYFMPPLMDALSRLAPQIQVHIHRPHAASLKEEMASGSIDLAIGLMPQLQAGFFQKRLFQQEYVCMFRQGHPVAKAPMTLAQFKQVEHVGVTAPHTGHGEIDSLLTHAGVQRRIRLVVPHFIAVGHILQSTDLVATLPERYAQRSKDPFGLVVSRHPVKLPKISINMFWHARYHRDPDNLWLRQLFSTLFSDR